MKKLIIAAAVIAVLVVAGIIIMGSEPETVTDQTARNAATNETEATEAESNVAAVEESEENTVNIENFEYTPQTITVKKGTRVTWTNRDSIAHTVTSDEGDKMDSALLSQNESYSVTFDEPGTYSYFCKPHPNMTGTVVVIE